MKKALSGIKVIDLSRIIAGPFCTMQLGDMGAEIIKVERPGTGDDLRSTPPFVNSESTYFLLNNRNKKSITIDFKKTMGKEIFWKLIEEADVLVENFRPGVVKKLGFGYEEVREKNPQIIYCSISGYGQDNPIGAYDPIVQGEAGIMSVNGEPDGIPVKVGVPIGDLVASLYAIQGILSGLIMRSTTGLGQYIEISLLESLVSLLALPGSVYLGSGENPPRVGNAHPAFTPYDVYKTKDGFINIAVANDSLWQRFCNALNLTDLKSEPCFSTIEDRLINRKELNGIIEKVLVKKTTQEWKLIFTKNEIPNGEIKSLKEVFADKNLENRNMINKMMHPKVGEYKFMGNPVKMSGQSIDYQRPPLLGEHTIEILKEIGFNEEEISKMRLEDVI